MINKESILSDIVKREDRDRKQMNILVNSLVDSQMNENSSIIKSKEVICPKCLEVINIKINYNTISLYQCKNEHNKNNLYYKDFINTQNIDLNNIICDECNQTNKHIPFNNQFYKCFTCDKNLCPLCKSKNNNSHKIIDYDKRNSVCEVLILNMRKI